MNFKHARDTTDALARIFALATPAGVADVWINGAARHEPSLSEAARKAAEISRAPCSVNARHCTLMTVQSVRQLGVVNVEAEYTPRDSPGGAVCNRQWRGLRAPVVARTAGRRRDRRPALRTHRRCRVHRHFRNRVGDRFGPGSRSGASGRESSGVGGKRRLVTSVRRAFPRSSAAHRHRAPAGRVRCAGRDRYSGRDRHAGCVRYGGGDRYGGRDRHAGRVRYGGSDRHAGCVRYGGSDRHAGCVRYADGVNNFAGPRTCRAGRGADVQSGSADRSRRLSFAGSGYRDDENTCDEQRGEGFRARRSRAGPGCAGGADETADDANQ